MKKQEIMQGQKSYDKQRRLNDCEYNLKKQGKHEKTGTSWRTGRGADRQRTSTRAPLWLISQMVNIKMWRKKRKPLRLKRSIQDYAWKRMLLCCHASWAPSSQVVFTSCTTQRRRRLLYLKLHQSLCKDSKHWISCLQWLLTVDYT